MLLDDLCAMKLLAKQGDRYRLVPEAEHYLLPDKPTYMGRYLLADFGWEGNGRLAEAIRTGRRPVGYGATTTEVIDTWIGVYARSWAAPETYLERCDVMWQELGIQARDGLQVLDVACGPAPKSLALARAHSGVHITLLDWEQILAIAGKVAADPMGPGLWLYAVSEGGAPYDFHEYKDMLERAGYSDIVDVSTQPIKATKRS